MPLYYFQLHECDADTIDEEGLDLVDITAARAVALDAARELMSAEVRNGTLCLSCYLVIEDADRREISRLTFSDAVEISAN